MATQDPEKQPEVAGEAPRTEVHTYPDGSQRVGVPPFPKESPLEEVAEEKRLQRPMAVPPGMKTSGAAEPEAGPNAADVIRERAVEQLTADVMSGKEPETPNPTTSSDKPELAGESGVVTADQLESGLAPVASAEPTAEELQKIAEQIEPKGNIEATDDEKAAAVAQVARETKGVIAADKPATKGSKK